MDPAEDPALGVTPSEPARPPPARPGVIAGLRAHFALLATDRLTWFATMAAAVVLTVSRYHGSTGQYHRVIRPVTGQEGGLWAWLVEAVLGPGAAAQWVRESTQSIAEYLYWFWGSSALFFLVPILAAALIPGVRVKELGVGLGDWRYGIKATALLFLVMLPFVVAVSFTPTFANHYPLSSGAVANGRSLLFFEAGYAAYFVGWEFVYRGLLCVALYPKLGAGAILLHAIPFAVMHGGKPEVEAYGSIIAALALGVVAVRARSFWYGALLHFLVAFSMDVLALTQTGRWPKAW